MIRKIIKIDEEKCNGCGLCANACHEGAIAIVDGKAKLISDEYCDGFGDCLPHCPQDAISFEMREAKAYSEEAVEKKKAGKPTVLNVDMPLFKQQSELTAWPCQIKLLPVNAPFFDGADLLIAADCTAFAYGSIHADFMKDKVTLIGCPKLDAVDYSEKLTDIFSGNNIKSVNVLRMQVPCCGGLENAVKRAILNSGKDIPLNVNVISVRGEIVK